VQNRTEGERHADIEDGAQPMDQIGTILVVDDEPDIAAIVAETLEKVGHRVHTANDGVTALHLLGETVYDLIISDTKMPAPENLDFYTELMRRHPEFGRRIIFITGDVLDPEKQKFLERTGAPCITKPFDPRLLPRVVRRALASSSGSPASA
jgi:CheY-like chemotaxis protein